MRNLYKSSLPLIMAVGLLTSCGDVSKKVEEKLDNLNNKAEQLDSLVNKEINKVMALDTLINIESDKIKKLDSLINKSNSQLDSISKKGTKLLEKITN